MIKKQFIKVFKNLHFFIYKLKASNLLILRQTQKSTVKFF